MWAWLKFVKFSFTQMNAMPEFPYDMYLLCKIGRCLFPPRILFSSPTFFQISRWHIHCTSHSVSKTRYSVFYLKNFKTASLRKNITVYCTYFSFLSRTSVDTRFVIQSHIKTNTSKTVKSSPVNMSPATHLICLLPDSTLVVSNPVSLTVSNP